MDAEHDAALPAPQVTRDDDAGRYVISVNGQEAGFLAFTRDADRVVFTHTAIDSAFNGQGLGTQLARGALADVRARGLRAVPMCRFVAGYLARHPEDADLVDEV